MTNKTKTVKASSIKTRAQFEKAMRDGVLIQYDEGYPQAPGNRPKKSATRKKK